MRIKTLRDELLGTGFWSPEGQSGCFFGGGGGGDIPEKQTIKSEPSDLQKPYLQNIFRRAQDASFKVPTSVPKKFVAGANPLERQGAQSLAGVAQNSQGLGQSAIDLGLNTLQGKFLDPQSNPAFQGAIDAALNPLFDRFQSQVVPSISSAAQSQGAYGGARHGIALAEGAEDLQRQAADTTAKLTFDQFNRERLLQQSAPGLIQQGLGLNAAPSQMLSQAGGQLRELDQLGINNALAKYQASLTAPFHGLNQFSSLVQATPYQNQTTTAAGGGTSGTGRFLQGALGGAALGGTALAGLTKAGVLAGGGGLAAAAPWLAIPALGAGLAGAFF